MYVAADVIPAIVADSQPQGKLLYHYPRRSLIIRDDVARPGWSRAASRQRIESRIERMRVQELGGRCLRPLGHSLGEVVRGLRRAAALGRRGLGVLEDVDDELGDPVELRTRRTRGS